MFERVKDWGSKNTKAILNTEQIKDVGSDIKEQSKFLNPFRKLVPGRVETFEEAMVRLEIKEEQLPIIYKNFKVRFYLFSGLFAISGVLAIVFLAQANFFGLGPSIGALFIGLSQMFTSSFRAYQIKTKTMKNIKEWWDASEDWFPSNFE